MLLAFIPPRGAPSRSLQTLHQPVPAGGFYPRLAVRPGTSPSCLREGWGMGRTLPCQRPRGPERLARDPFNLPFCRRPPCPGLGAPWALEAGEGRHGAPRLSEAAKLHFSHPAPGLGSVRAAQRPGGRTCAPWPQAEVCWVPMAHPIYPWRISTAFYC